MRRHRRNRAPGNRRLRAEEPGNPAGLATRFQDQTRLTTQTGQRADGGPRRLDRQREGSSNFVHENDPQLLIGARPALASLPLGLSFTLGIGHRHGDDRPRDLAHVGLLASLGIDDDLSTLPGTFQPTATSRPPIGSTAVR